MNSKTEPLLEPDDNRFVMFPIKYDDIWEMYKKQIDCFWRTEEIDLTKDMTHWETLNADEKYFISMILAFFAASDGIVLENLATRFMKDVQVSEARAFYGFQIAMENIHCVTGYTKILTDKGYFPIKHLENQFVNVWNGYTFSNVQIKYTGDQAIYKVTLSNGMELDCTSGHKWLIKYPEFENNEYHKKETCILNINDDVLIDYNIPLIQFSDENDHTFLNPYTHGFACGTIVDNYCVKIDDNENNKEIMKCIKYSNIIKNGHIFSINIGGQINKPLYEIPMNYSIDVRLRWLEGLIDSAGNIHGITSRIITKEDGSYSHKYDKPPALIHIYNENKRFLMDVQLLLTTLGVFSSIDESFSRYFKVNDIMVFKEVLIINAKNCRNLFELGFMPKKLITTSSCLPDMLSKYNNGNNDIKIIEIKKISEDEPTYCFNEPLMHQGIFNGILTGQSETYSVLIETYIKNKELKNQYFNAISHYPCIEKKAQWAQKWIHDKESDFATRLVGFACVEGIFFSGAFCSIFWLKKRGLMPGLTFSNELISRDEALHCEFAILLYSKLNEKLDTDKIHQIIKEAVEIETEFICDALPCRLIGMNSDMMTQYIKFVADRLSLQLGYPKIYNASNCFPWMELISLESKTNFFEKRNDSYALATKKVDDDTFEITDDF